MRYGYFDMLPENAFRSITGKHFGKLMTLEGSKGGGSPPPPDTNPGMIENAEAARDVGKMQKDTATEYLNFAKQQYADNKGFLADIAQAEANMMRTNQQRAEEYAEYERDTFRPMEKELIGKAKAYNEDAMRERMAQQSAADTNAAFDGAKQQALRNLARYGINPNSGRFAALNAQIGTQQAGALAAGQNQARMQAEGLGYARMQDAVALGKGLAPNASTAYGIALQGGDSAAKNSQAGANYMGNAYNQASNQLGNATQSFGTAGNIYGQEFNARMQGYNAQQQANAQSSAGFGQLLGTGIGVAAKLGAFGGFSMKEVKENKKKIPEGKALKGIKNLDVEEWNYKKGIEDEGRHIGPYADDFKREFGIGDGKNLSLLDIRFARTINRIQKSMIAELNKIAIIHLFLLGFEDELTNFTLSLNNPSKQGELLSLEIWKEKITLYKDACAEIANSVAPVSASWAKKHILGFSDEEIRLDIQQQRVERAVAAELAKTAEVITKTGLFDNIDNLYGKKDSEPAGEAPAGGAEAGGAPPSPDMGGGGEAAPPPAPEGGGLTPERLVRKDLDLLLEENLFNGRDFMDLSKGRLSLDQIDQKLKDLIDK